MKQKEVDLTNSMWISRFWAQYHMLPEPFKEGFYSFALSVSKEAESESSEQRVDDGERVLSEFRCNY